MRANLLLLPNAAKQTCTGMHTGQQLLLLLHQRSHRAGQRALAPALPASTDELATRRDFKLIQSQSVACTQTSLNLESDIAIERDQSRGAAAAGESDIGAAAAGAPDALAPSAGCTPARGAGATSAAFVAAAASLTPVAAAAAAGTE